MPRLQQLYEWSANELGAPGLLDCAHDGTPVYAWPLGESTAWLPPRSLALQLAHRALPTERPGVTALPDRFMGRRKSGVAANEAPQ
jgi:hypothetical protein